MRFVRPFAIVAALATTSGACALSPTEPKASPRPAARAGGTIRVAVTEPNSIEPSRASNAPGVLVLKQICDPLVSADPVSGVLRPGAAESWKVSGDAKKVTFKIRPGVKFHNGREVVAQDYVFSISRFAGKDTGNSKRFWLDRVVGYRDVAEGRASTLAGVKAPDPRTVEIELSEPFAELPAVLSHPAAGSAIPKEEVDKGADVFATQPVCTGPYALKDRWLRGQDLRLVRAPSYAAKNPAYSRGGAGYADEIVLTIVPDLETGYRRLDEGKVDVAEAPIGGRLVEARRVKGRLAEGSNGHVAYVGFPVKKAPFDNLELRKALALSIDRRAIIERLLAGSRRMPSGILPGSAGPAAAGLSCRETMKPGPDVEGAKKALQASGVDPAATRLNVYFNDGASGHEKWLQKVTEQWKTGLGIESTLRPDEFRRYLDFLAEYSHDGPFRLAWSVDYPSPEAMFPFLFASGSLDNFTGYASQEFDGLLRKARETADDEARRKAYIEAGKVLCRDLPVIVMWFGVNHIAFGARVTSAVATRVDIFGDPILRELGAGS